VAEFVCGVEKKDPGYLSACENLPEYRDTGYCVLHFPGEEKKEDLEQVKKDKLEQEDYDFSGTVFPEGTADFGGVEFHRDTHFTDAPFIGGADFREAQFSGDWTYFDRAHFSGGWTSFYRAHFSGERTSFYRAQFGSAETSFQEATFAKEVYFSGVTFSEKVTFWGVFSSSKNSHRCSPSIHQNSPQRLVPCSHVQRSAAIFGLHPWCTSGNSSIRHNTSPDFACGWDEEWTEVTTVPQKRFLKSTSSSESPSPILCRDPSPKRRPWTAYPDAASAGNGFEK
jgi:hypothetical protein